MRFRGKGKCERVCQHARECESSSDPPLTLTLTLLWSPSC